MHIQFSGAIALKSQCNQMNHSTMHPIQTCAIGWLGGVFFDGPVCLD